MRRTKRQLEMVLEQAENPSSASERRTGVEYKQDE
jgi:hypothetical protein